MDDSASRQQSHTGASPSPGTMAMQAVKTRKLRYMPPPATRPATSAPKITVLQEDDFEDKMLAIIERDYFPDMKRMQNKVEWLQATDSGDPAAIRAAQLNIARRRAGHRVPLDSPAHESPSGTEAPQRSAWGTHESAGDTGGAGPSGQPSQAMTGIAPPMSLNTFAFHHTSEDQASLEALVEDDNTRKRKRYDWAYKESDRTNAPLNLEPVTGVIGAIGASGSTRAELVPWKHVPKSLLYYPPTAVSEYTAHEIALRSIGAPPETRAANTRFPSRHAAFAGDCDTASTIPSTGSIADSSPAASSIGDSHLDDPTKSAPLCGTNQVGGGRGYAPIATPSLAPGSEGTPMITWGDIDGTPLRIDGDAEPGESFTMLEPRIREKAGVAMQKKANRSDAKASRRCAMHRLTGSVARRKQIGVSPAAVELSKKIRGSSPWLQTDTQLRASYGHRTPGSSRRGVSASPWRTPSHSGTLSNGGALANMTPTMTPTRRSL